MEHKHRLVPVAERPGLVELKCSCGFREWVVDDASTVEGLDVPLSMAEMFQRFVNGADDE